MGSRRSTTWLAAALAFLAVEAALILYVDKGLSLWLRQIEARDPGLIGFFRAFTELGNSKWYLWPSGLGALACLAALRWGGLRARAQATLRWTAQTLGFLFLAVAGSGLSADLIKAVIGRARPVVLERQDIYGFHPWSWFQPQWHSLPSGHATTAFALAFVAAAVAPRWRVAALLTAVVLAASRVMTNEHYLSDIIAGAVVGWFTVLWMETPLRRRGWLPDLPVAQPATLRP
jgi:undecaprenyl-diphosphatase